MRTTRLFALGVILAGVLLVGVSGSAVATEEEADSQPNGDFYAAVFARADTDRDHDGNPDTATKPDRLDTLVAVCTNFNRSQLVEYTVTVDAPWTDFDRQFSDVADFVAPMNFGCDNLFVVDKVSAQWPSGPYSVTLQATNGSDQATVTGTVMITAR
jgi:hypothetical protein